MGAQTYTEAQLQALRDALARGERRVTFGDKTVEYRTVDELLQAIRQIEAEIYKNGPYPQLPRQIRVITQKGF